MKFVNAVFREVYVNVVSCSFYLAGVKLRLNRFRLVFVRCEVHVGDVSYCFYSV